MTSNSEEINVCNLVIEDVINNMQDVFKEECINYQVLNDLKALWQIKLKKYKNKTHIKHEQITLVPMKVMVPYKKMDSLEVREIELMIPEHEVEDLNLQRVFSDGIMNAAVNLSSGLATTFLQQRINHVLLNKEEFREVPVVVQEVSSLKEEIKIEPQANIMMPQLDGANGYSDNDSSESDEYKSTSSHKSDEDNSSYGTDEESLNSNDDVTDEDTEILFECDNVIVCQYLKVLRNKNKWKFYFKDGFMNLDGCDYVFQRAIGEALW